MQSQGGQKSLPKGFEISKAPAAKSLAKRDKMPHQSAKFLAQRNQFMQPDLLPKGIVQFQQLSPSAHGLTVWFFPCAMPHVDFV